MCTHLFRVEKRTQEVIYSEILGEKKNSEKLPLYFSSFLQCHLLPFLNSTHTYTHTHIPQKMLTNFWITLSHCISFYLYPVLGNLWNVGFLANDSLQRQTRLQNLGPKARQYSVEAKTALEYVWISHFLVVSPGKLAQPFSNLVPWFVKWGYSRYSLYVDYWGNNSVN